MPWTWARAMPSGVPRRRAGRPSRAAASCAARRLRSADGTATASRPPECRRVRRAGGTAPAYAAVAARARDAGRRARRCRCWCSPGARMTAARRDPMRASRMRAYRRRAYRRRRRRRACRRRTRRGRRMPRGPRGIRVRGDGCVPCGVRGACASVLRRQSAGFRVMGLRRDGGRAAGLRQRLADRVRDEAVHGAAVAEAHLMLGGMDVDVHRGGIDVQEQHIGRLAVAMQHVGVAARSVADRAVAHEAAVDV